MTPRSAISCLPEAAYALQAPCSRCEALALGPTNLACTVLLFECLNMEWLGNRIEASVIIEYLRQHYNEVRPHSGFGYLTPQQAAQADKTESTTQISFQMVVV